jgi:hypothetical protein
VPAHEHAILLHEEQSVDEQGMTVGDAPATDIFGIRWSAINNLFLTAGIWRRMSGGHRIL